MRITINRWLLILVFLILSALSTHNSQSTGLNCSIVASGNCNNAALLYMKNDSGGYFNAHAQVPSNGSYPFAVCCDANQVNDTINTNCGDAVFLKLQNETNSHVQFATLNNYSNSICINAVKGNVSCNYFNNSCPANYTCLTSMASSETSDGNTTNAHVGSCDKYITKVCCTLNAAPNITNLVSPANNSEITNRTPNFLWNASDPENNSLTFDLYIRCNGGCSIDNRDYLSLNYSNYTIPTELKYFGDDNYNYTWWVRAFDGTSYSDNSTSFTFKLVSLVSLTMVNDTINFGSVNIGQINNTTTNNPAPFVMRNDGNSFIDINLSANKTLWNSKPDPSAFFRYKVDNLTGETTSFNWSGSTTDWTDVPIVNQTFLKLLNYSDATDTAEIDILVQVPLDESVGNKVTILTFTGKYVRVDI